MPERPLLFVSAHLDDVAFSVGGTLMLLARARTVVLATAFTRSVPDPTGFALACQTDKGIAPEVDYLALRRAEDERFAQLAGAEEVRWLDLPEAPHRGYGSAPELFGRPHADDRAAEELAPLVAGLVDELDPAAIFAPQALGGHVDHVALVEAIARAGALPRCAWYRDVPYALRDPGARPSPLIPAGLPERAIDIGAVLERKLDGCAAYASQLGFQFGDEAGMRAALRRFHREEAAFAGRGGVAELLTVTIPEALPDAPPTRTALLGGAADPGVVVGALFPGARARR